MKMNNIYMLAVIVLCIAADAVGQEMARGLDKDTYRPMLTEGRSWVTMITNVNPMPGHDVDQTVYIKVAGDTVIDGRSCKIIIHDNVTMESTYKTVLLEEDKVIYEYDENMHKFLPLMDFNLHEGDDIREWLMIQSEDVVEVDGIVYRRIGIGYKDDNKPLAYWVEGIGASKDYWITLFPAHIGEYSYMKECYENDECVFTKDDFYKEAAGIDAIPSSSGVEDDAVYDLQGRRLRHTVPGINIVNGKKILTR